MPKWQTRQCCSKKCAAQYRGAPWLEKHQIQKGQHLGTTTQFSSGTVLGESNVNWKGDEASYAAIHMWMRYHHGSPKLCELCGVTDRKMYHWANISGTYRRVRADWLRLCVPCHKRRDLTKVKEA